MINNTFIFFWVVLGLAVSSAVSAASISLKSDPLGYLIQHVDYQRDDTMEKLENRLIGRASWNIQCWIKESEDTKICTMRKNNITVMRMNNHYSLSVGLKIAKNSSTVLKVDDNNALQAREGLYRDAQPIIDQFKRGIGVKTEFKPSYAIKVVASETSLVGFTDAFNDMQQQYGRLDNLESQRRI